MNSCIVVLGDIPGRDLQKLKETASLKGYDVVIYKDAKAAEHVLETGLPLAYISFLPCTPETVIDIFGYLPIGSGERIPFFQLVGENIPDCISDMPFLGVFQSPLTLAVITSVFLVIQRNGSLIQQNNNLVSEVINYRYQKLQLVKMGTALSSESDLEDLLQMILTISRDMLGADAGSIYIRQRSVPGGPLCNTLLFKIAQNDSVDIGLIAEHQIPINTNSIAGYVAKTAKALNIDDVRCIDAAVPYRFDTSFEQRYGYRTKSMLTVPLVNHDGEVVGVLQLINKKDDGKKSLSADQVDSEVEPFTLSDEDFVHSVASQAAVSIERAQLHESIKALFEGFLSSSIAAIDERDRVTSGHSKRVMGYVTAFLDAAAKEPSCPFSVLVSTPERRRQFQFAALLHDIGKIGVPEHLLTKEKRLQDGEFSSLMMRMDYIEMQLTINASLVSWISVKELHEDREFLHNINRAGYITDEQYFYLSNLSTKEYTAPDGQRVPFLSIREWDALSVRSGNLTVEERKSINSHAVSTRRILSKIPWTKNLELVPLIASQHHERIDGTGYPEGLTGDQMLLESKILALIDIYEALVAQDRPYKPKMHPEKALMILQEETENGHLDRDVLAFFREKEIYKIYGGN